MWHLVYRWAPLTPIGLTLLAFLVSLNLSPRKYYVSIGPSFHVTLSGGHVWFFNNAEYGPYQGSIVGLSGGEYPKVTHFGYWGGIYYRHFRWPDNELWTLAICGLYPLILAVIVSLTWETFRRWRGGSDSARIGPSP